MVNFFLFYLEHFSYLALFLFISVSHFIPLPEEAILIALGYISSLGFGSVFKFTVVSFFGILIADSLAYFVARKKGEVILQIIGERFRIAPQKIEKTKLFFHKNAGTSVFLARFVIGFRFLMPFVAGALGLPFDKFLFSNALGSAIWIPGVIFLSYWLSAFFDLYAGFTRLKHGIWLGAILIVGFWVGWREFKKI